MLRYSGMTLNDDVRGWLVLLNNFQALRPPSPAHLQDLAVLLIRLLHTLRSFGARRQNRSVLPLCLAARVLLEWTLMTRGMRRGGQDFEAGATVDYVACAPAQDRRCLAFRGSGAPLPVHDAFPPEPWELQPSVAGARWNRCRLCGAGGEAAGSAKAVARVEQPKVARLRTRHACRSTSSSPFDLVRLLICCTRLAV